MERNFEDAHGYSHSSSLGKPLSAYRLVQGWDIDDTNIKAIEALMFCLEYDASLDVLMKHGLHQEALLRQGKLQLQFKGLL
ncbi:hypothetical protein CW734_04545 [Planococcus sp. MB-3u-03]|nr:hypothetical protein CW734_04545 [Planococcus sp. MB-3u-03]